MQILHPCLLSLPLSLQVLDPYPLLPALPESPVLFIISTYNLISVSPPLFSLLPSLHDDHPSSSDEDYPMLAALHSFVSSISFPPLTPSTALEQYQQPREKRLNFYLGFANREQPPHNGRYRPSEWSISTISLNEK
ncbi:hypothetical protein AAC387_Pa01g1305 [Persea americana]